jgi:hypothetical protein
MAVVVTEGAKFKTRPVVILRNLSGWKRGTNFNMPRKNLVVSGEMIVRLMLLNTAKLHFPRP